MASLATILVALFASLLFVQGALGQPSACVNNVTSSACACTVAGGISTVDCTGLSNGGAIPTQIPIATTALILKNNGISQLMAQAFNTYSSLSLLNLQSNSLTTLPSGVFSGLSNLLSLFLSKNPLVQLPSDAFQPLSNLKILYLDSCTLTSIAAGLFAPLTSLQTLNLAGNVFSIIVDTWFTTLTALQTLDLSSNSLTSASSAQAFQAQSNLVTLDLRNNQLAQLPNAIFNHLTSLTELDLEFNLLQGILFLAVNSLSVLATLTLGHNQINSVASASLTSLTSLTYLSLDSNTLTTIPTNVFTAQTQLTQLYLGNNPWDCCGLEWLRSYAPLQDPQSVICDRPELWAGSTLVSSNNNVSVCSTDLPTPPTAPLVSQTSPFSVLLTWNASAGNAYAVDYYQVQYATVDNNGPWITFQCAGGQLPVRLDGGSMALNVCNILSKDYFGNAINPLTATISPPLAPFTNYSFRIISHTPLNGGYLSTPGTASAQVRTLTFTPSQPSPPTVIPNKTAITVTILPPTPPNGIITQYVVRLLSSGSALQSQVTVSTLQASFTMLTPFTTYLVTVQAYTAAGAGPVSNAAVTTTLEDAPATPQAPILLNSSSQSLTVGWSSIPLPQANGNITAYYLTVLFPNGTSTVLNLGRNLNYTITSLQPANYYVFRLSAATAGGVSSLSNLLNVTTLDAVPSQPYPPAISAILSNATCLLLQWQLPALPNGPIVRYDIYQWLNTTYVTVTSFPGSLYSTTLCGLSPATNYQFAIRAFTILGGSQLSTNATGRTADAVASPTKVTSYVATATSLNISWPPPVPYDGNILFYELYLVKTTRTLLYYAPFEDDTEVLLYNGTDTTFFVDELQPATNYYHLVLAYTSAGASNITTITQGLTSSDVPSRPGTPLITVVDSSTVTLRWTYPTYPNGNITQFGIFTQDSNIPILLVSGAVTNVTVPQLQSQTTYAFTVAAYTIAGMGDSSRSASITTPQSNPSYTQTIVIVVVVAFVVILSIGFMYERSRNSVTRQVAPSFEHGGLGETQPNTMTLSTDAFASQPAGHFQSEPHRSSIESTFKPGESPLAPRPSTESAAVNTTAAASPTQNKTALLRTFSEEGEV